MLGATRTDCPRQENATHRPTITRTMAAVTLTTTATLPSRPADAVVVVVMVVVVVVVMMMIHNTTL